MLPVLLQATPIPFSAYALCFLPLAAVVFGLFAFFYLTDRHANRPYLRYNPFIAATVPPEEALQRPPAVGETPAGPLGAPAGTTGVYMGGPVGAVVRVPQGEQPPADAPADYQPSFEGSTEGIGHTPSDDAPARPGDTGYRPPTKGIAQVQPGPIDEPTLNAGGSAITTAFRGIFTPDNAAGSPTSQNRMRNLPAAPAPQPSVAGPRIYEVDAGTAATGSTSAQIVSIAGIGSQESGAEYVRIANTSNAPVDMTGWVLRDQAGHATFTFPGFVLAPGAEVRIWSGAGTDNSTNLYWGDGSASWGGAGNTAILENLSGDEISRFGR